MTKRQRATCLAIKQLIALIGFDRVAAIWETPELILQKSRGQKRPSSVDAQLANVLLNHPELVHEVLDYESKNRTAYKRSNLRN